MMYQAGAVCRVLAIIARIVMTAEDIHFSLVYKGVQAGLLTFQNRRGMFGVSFSLGRALGDDIPRVRESGHGDWHLRLRCMAWAVLESSKRQRIVRATTLMIQPKGVGSRECARHPFANREWERATKAGHLQPIL